MKYHVTHIHIHSQFHISKTGSCFQPLRLVQKQSFLSKGIGTAERQGLEFHPVLFGVIEAMETGSVYIDE
jgi:hypothetical protein